MSVKLSPIVAGVMNWGVWDKNLNTKEMIYCAFICGKMQEVDVEMAALLFMKTRLAEKINQ